MSNQTHSQEATTAIVTLDGPAGVGKTTLSRQLAHALGMAYLDTGAMYRAVAFALGDKGWERPEDEIAATLAQREFALHGSGDETQLALDGFALGDELRSEEVGRWASLVAKLPVVRQTLVGAQKCMGKTRSLVAEGRDMGTVVFPHAACKFFLEARPEIRAERRHAQLLRLGQTPPPMEEMINTLRIRDEEDRTRAVSPLVPAPDAIMVDTSEKTADQVFEELLQAAHGCLGVAFTQRA